MTIRVIEIRSKEMPEDIQADQYPYPFQYKAIVEIYTDNTQTKQEIDISMTSSQVLQLTQHFILSL
jgi:hypothetical protein